MKRTVSIFILAILAIIFFNAAPTDINRHNAKVAIIKFNTDTIDYGSIKQHANGLKTFKFINEGDAPLTITNVKTSCGCTVPSYSKTPILPGQSGELQIKYDTKRIGAFTKTITVMSNAEGGNKILRIKGNIVTSKQLKTPQP